MELLASTPPTSAPRMKPRRLQFDEPGTPMGSPTHRREAAYYSDRFIPIRSPNTLFDFDAAPSEENIYSMVLRNELMGNEQAESREQSPSAGSSPSSRNLFRFSSSPTNSSGSPFSLSPMSKSSQKLLECPRKPPRNIPRTPFKTLEAPSIQDDFYLNLVDWGSQNLVAVALGSSVYLWNALTSSVNRLCDLSGDQVTSVAWADRGSHLAVGSTAGTIQIWDATKSAMVQEVSAHRQRVCAMSWNRHTLASGSRDRNISCYDTRARSVTNRFVGHKQEICGLRWSPDYRYLASGGNDNKLLVWDPAATAQPLHRLTEHSAAVKAIAWSPHQRSLLASGGGTVDRSIRIWNLSGETPLKSTMSIDTGSQVCNLAWSKNVNEIVSTHGYSQNQVVVWSFPSMAPIANLTGHTMRVLYLAVSPDGQTIITGAGDETLRLWNVFPGPKSGPTAEHLSSLASRMEIR